MAGCPDRWGWLSAAANQLELVGHRACRGAVPLLPVLYEGDATPLAGAELIRPRRYARLHQ